mgnify:CR=1 FL=1
MNAIELKQVNFSYDGKTKILENTDFTAEYGEVTLLSGHSGEGKSTLMYIVSGIIPNVNYGELTGEVKIAGEDIKGKKLGYVCRKVGVVLQNADEQIIQKIVEDEIAFGCENLAFPPEKIQKQINIVCNLLKLDKTWKCRTLSGGQKQRIAIAGMLAIEPQVLVLDEATAMLDPLGRKDILRIVKDLNRKKGITVIMITQYMEEAVIADRVIVMNEGLVAFEGTPAEVFRRGTELRKINLDVPPMVELRDDLAASGIIKPCNAMTVEEMANELCPLLLKI